MLSVVDYPTIMGFEPLVNQRLLPPTFPRYTKIRSREDTLDYIEKLVDRLRMVAHVPDNQALHSVIVSHTYLLTIQCLRYPLATSPVAIIWPIGRLKLVSGKIFGHKLQAK